MNKKLMLGIFVVLGLGLIGVWYMGFKKPLNEDKHLKFAEEPVDNVKNIENNISKSDNGIVEPTKSFRITELNRELNNKYTLDKEVDIELAVNANLYDLGLRKYLGKVNIEQLETVFGYDKVVGILKDYNKRTVNRVKIPDKPKEHTDLVLLNFKLKIDNEYPSEKDNLVEFKPDIKLNISGSEKEDILSNELYEFGLPKFVTMFKNDEIKTGDELNLRFVGIMPMSISKKAYKLNMSIIDELNNIYIKLNTFDTPKEDNKNGTKDSKKDK